MKEANSDHDQPLHEDLVLFLRRLYPIMILNTIAVGMMWPALPQILLPAFENDAASLASFFARINAINAILDFIANPILGALSDVHGRRVLLLLSLVVASFCNILVAVYRTPNVVIVSKILFGLFNITKAMCYSMVVDVMDRVGTGRPQRVKVFGMIGMAIGGGFAFGPLIGGLIGAVSPVLTAAVASIIMLISVILAYTTIDESLQQSKKSSAGSCIGKCKNVVMLGDFRLLKFSVPFLLAGIAAGPYSIWYLYSERRYGWSSSKNGFFLAEYGLASVLAQGVLLPRLTPRFMTEGAVVAGSFLTNVALFAAYGALRSRDSSLLFAILPLSLMGTLSEPVLRQVFSQLVASEDQGAMQGALSSLSTLANASGPMIAAGLFSWGVHAPCGWEAAFFGGCANLVGAPFFASSFLFLLAFVTSQSAFADDGTTRPRPDEASPLLVRKLADHTDAP